MLPFLVPPMMRELLPWPLVGQPQPHGMDGFEVCERTRRFSTVPIMMLTASDRLDDVVRSMDVGATDYVRNPFDIDKLLDRVRALLTQA